MDQKKIGEYIAKKRKEKGMTQAKLAEKLGISDRAISNWENGKNMPDLGVFNELCLELGITINEFLNGEDINCDDYQQKLEENIFRLTLNMNRIKKVVKRLFLVLLLLLGLGILVIFGYACINNYWNYGTVYDARVMKCEFKDNELIYMTLGNVLQTEHYERVVDNKKYYIFHSFINVFDVKDNMFNYGGEISSQLMEMGSNSFFESYLGEEIKYDDVLVYYSVNGIKRLDKISDKKFIDRINDLPLVCSYK